MKVLCFLFVMLLIGCHSIDKSNPEAVLKAYEKLSIAGDFKSEYELLSTKS